MNMPASRRDQGSALQLHAGSAERTYAWLHERMAAMGITRIANITGLDSIGIPVAVACRPNSRGLAVAQGAGSDVTVAKISAVMESAEAFHAEHIVAPLLLATYDELRKQHQVVDVSRLPATRDGGSDPRARLLWIESRNLVDDAPVWVPYECVHTDFTLPLPAGSGCFQASSNGLGAGRDLAEAIVHGLCEVVERDATALWWHDRDAGRPLNRIDLSAIDDPDCMKLLDAYSASGVEVAVWETTTDTGIPSFFSAITPKLLTSDFHLETSDGMGCHMRRELALRRSLAEAAQSRLTVLAGSRDDITRHAYGSAHATAQAQLLRTMVMTPGSTTRLPATARDGDDWNGSSDGLAWLQQQMIASGFDQVLVVDLTKDEVGIPVVRVVVPGLEGVCFQPDYSAGARAQQRCVSP